MKYLLIFFLLSALVVCEDSTDQIEDATRKINLELGGIVESVTEVKFRPLKGTKYFYHVVPREYDD